jgi:hypothetical protein
MTISGPTKWVRLGDLDLPDLTDVSKPQDFAVAETLIHHKYKSSSRCFDKSKSSSSFQ